MSASVVVGVSVFAVAAAWRLYRLYFPLALKLPGRLQPSGNFDLKDADLADPTVRKERERDFERVCASGSHLYLSNVRRESGASQPKLVELPDKGSFAEFSSALEELVGPTAAEVLRERAFALVSATTPFEFATGVGEMIPSFGDSRYVLVKEYGALRVFWAAFLRGDMSSSRGVDNKEVMPFFVCFVSEPLYCHDKKQKTRFSYWCEPNDSLSLSAKIDAHFARGTLEAAADATRDDTLIEAAKAGDEERLEALLEVGVSASAVDPDGLNALIHAVVHDFGPETVSALMDRGAATATKEHTAVRAASLHGRLGLLELLLRSGADASRPSNNGRTALMGAVFHRATADPLDCLGCLRLLLRDDRGRATLNSTNDDGETALHLTAIRGSTDAARILIEAGADAEIRNNQGLTYKDLMGANAKRRKKDQ